MTAKPLPRFSATEPCVIVFDWRVRSELLFERAIEPIRVWWGMAEGTSEFQWLMEGFDLDTQTHRIFAMRDMLNVRAG